MNNNRASWECYINTTVMCNLIIREHFEEMLLKKWSAILEKCLEFVTILSVTVQIYPDMIL